MPQRNIEAAERIAASIQKGDADETRGLLTGSPECRVFLDLPDSITGLGIDAWCDYAERHGHGELSSMLTWEFPDPVYRGIYDAIRSGNVAGLEQLFRDHPRYVNGLNGGLENLLVAASRAGQLRVAQLLLNMGARINAVDMMKATALTRAVDFAGPEMVEYLLEFGADTRIGRPLIGAISREPEGLALRLVQLLVENGADVNREYTVFGDKNDTFTALEWAAGKPKVAEYLRSKGAVDRPPKETSMTTPKNLSDEIVAYFGEHFGVAQPQAQIEIVPTDPPIAIHVIPASDDRNHVTLFTTGVSEQAMTVPDGTDDFRFAELFIQLPGNWPIDKQSLASQKHGWPIHWLRSIAKYPHQHCTWLGGPVTIIANGDPPEPLAPGLKFTSLLVMADQQFTAHDGRTIYLYRLLPLYTEERNLEIKEGIAVLMRALDAADISFVVDLARPNVALGMK